MHMITVEQKWCGLTQSIMHVVRLRREVERKERKGKRRSKEEGERDEKGGKRREGKKGSKK